MALPDDIQPVTEFAYLTGWRINSEVLTLEWRQVDFDGAEVRLEPGTTKNKKGRMFPFTTALRTLLQERQIEHEKLKKAGHIIPNVFWRMVADERGGVKKPRAILRFEKEWKAACKAAGCRAASRTICAGLPSAISCARAFPKPWRWR